jgi:hypothetical protein
MKRIIWIASAAVVIILVAIAVGLSLRTSPSGVSTLTTSTNSSHTTSSTPSSSTASSSLNFIAISGGMSLCSSNCNYPGPYLSGTVLVNSTVPLRSIQLFINGTLEGTSNYSNNSTKFAIGYKANPTDQSMPIVSGKTYLIVLVGKFQDNASSVASVVLTAT